MAGKLIIHGFEQFVVGGKVDILFDSKKIGSVGKKQAAEFIFQQDTTMVVQCGINPMKSSIELKNGMLTEVQCVYNRITGKVEANVVSETPYRATSEDLAQAVEQPIYVLDGGAKDVLYAFEDRVVISHHGVLNALSMGIKGDKTIYYSDITSVQYKAPGILTGYLQFSLPGGNENQGGVFSAINDENTITIVAKNAAKRAAKAQEVVDFLNKKLREAKTGAHSTPTVIQQSVSAADELKKFKDLLDSGAITQEEFDAKKKQLLGL